MGDWLRSAERGNRRKLEAVRKRALTMEVHETLPNSAALFQYPTPNEIILNRIVVPMMDLITNYSDFGVPERSKAGSDLIDLVTVIARKMWSVWKHANDYHTIENRLVEEYSKIESPHHVLF